MELVFATHNKNKLREVELLMPQGFKLLSLDTIGCNEEIPETGQTLSENAVIKATHVFNTYHKICFADDTGLLVDVLNGEPGVYSARYAGDQKNADDNIDQLLARLSNSADRTASFVTVIALKTSDDLKIFKGVVKGHITKKRKGRLGFGYDPVFQPIGYDQTFAEMSTEQKNKISHRGLALKELTDYLAQWQ